MKILFVIAHIGKGGGQQIQAINLINEISKHHECQLVTLRYPSKIINVPSPTEYAGFLRFPQGIFDLKRYIKKHSINYEITQVFDPYYGLPAVWLSKKRPFLLRVGMDPIQDLRYRKKYTSAMLGKITLPIVLKSCAKIVVNSRHFLKHFATYNPIYIPNGYDFQSLFTDLSREECRDRLGFPIDEPILLFTGKVIPRKNLEIVFETMKNLDNIFFAVVGNTNEPLYGDHYFKELYSGYKEIMDRVIFTDELPMWEIKYVLKACDAFVFPSQLEGSPNSVLEAMAAGLPVMCSDISSHKEIIEHGKTGMLFHDGKDLKECIFSIVNDENLAKRMGESGKEYVFRNHNIAEIAQKYITLYDDVLEKY